MTAKRKSKEERRKKTKEERKNRVASGMLQKKLSQQKKGKARLRAYEELCDEATKFTARADLDSITIPAAPRLGDVVVDVKGLSKGYEGRGLLIDGFDCMVPPGAVVGIVGAKMIEKQKRIKMIQGSGRNAALEPYTGSFNHRLRV